MEEIRRVLREDGDRCPVIAVRKIREIVERSSLTPEEIMARLDSGYTVNIYVVGVHRAMLYAKRNGMYRCVRHGTTLEFKDLARLKELLPGGYNAEALLY